MPSKIFVLSDFAVTHDPRSGISNTAHCAQYVIIRINATVIISNVIDTTSWFRFPSSMQRENVYTYPKIRVSKDI